jgi:uncharacterized protein YjiS (DUF1127 family)
MLVQIALALLYKRSANASANRNGPFNPASLSGLIARCGERRRAIREWRELSQLNDHLLRDIGLRRDALFLESSKQPSGDTGRVDRERAEKVAVADPKRLRRSDARSG